MLGNARSGEACVPGACCPLGIAAQIPGTDRRPGFATTGFPQRFPGSRTAEPRQTQRFHQQKSRAAGAGTVPRAVPALPTPRSPSGTQRQVCHTAPRRTQRLRAAKPHPSSSQELSPAAPLPASLQHCTAHCSSLRVQADARLCFSMRGHTLSYKGNLFRLRKLM